MISKGALKSSHSKEVKDVGGGGLSVCCTTFSPGGLRTRLYVAVSSFIKYEYINYIYLSGFSKINLNNACKTLCEVESNVQILAIIAINSVI